MRRLEPAAIAGVMSREVANFRTFWRSTTFSSVLEPVIYLCAFGLGLSTIPFLINIIYSMRNGPRAGRNPWDAATLEWTVPSPPGHGNFDKIPTVYHGPYEYSVPDMESDFLPQNQPFKSQLPSGH